MPHGGGGGHSGGGSHHSSHHGGSSGSQSHYSNRPFKNSRPFVYYMGYRPFIVYSDIDPRKSKPSIVFPMIIISFMAIIEPVMVFSSAYHSPKKNTASHDQALVIDDQTDVITDSEELELKSIFTEFHEKTGVMPAIMTVNNSEWSWSNLEDYAYSKYTAKWKDESHWLIVYSAKEGTEKTNWHYEIMQGYDSDDILYDSIKDRYFHPVLCDSLDGSFSVGESFVKAFNSLLPHLMEKDFYVDGESIFFTVLWESIILIAGFAVVRSFIKEKAMTKAEPLPEGQSVELKKCPNCGASYYKGTVDHCRKCGRSFLDDEFEGI